MINDISDSRGVQGMGIMDLIAEQRGCRISIRSCWESEMSWFMVHSSPLIEEDVTARGHRWGCTSCSY